VGSVRAIMSVYLFLKNYAPDSITRIERLFT